MEREDVRLLGERIASFVALAEVVFAVLLAWVLLREAPTAMQATGALLVMAGVAMVRRWADVSPDDLPAGVDLTAFQTAAMTADAAPPATEPEGQA